MTDVVDLVQMMYIERDGKVVFESRKARRLVAEATPRLVAEIKWLRRTRPCSCDGDPIECNHEAARGHAEAERDLWKTAHDEFLAAWMETIPADERGDDSDPEATILAWAQMLAEQLEHANAALAGSDEGLRLWRLDCHAVVERHRRLTLQMTAERDALADRLAPTVWDASVPPGGMVCSAPMPGKPGGRCGMPVESEPCAEHDLEARLQRAETEAQRLREGMTRLAANWRQQQRWHGRDAERMADDPDRISTYRELCTKTAVYERAINEVNGLLDGGEKPC